MCGVLAAHISVCTFVFDHYLLSPREPKVVGEKSVSERAESGVGDKSRILDFSFRIILKDPLSLDTNTHPAHSDLFVCWSRHNICFTTTRGLFIAAFTVCSSLFSHQLTGVSMASYNCYVSSFAAIYTMRNTLRRPMLEHVGSRGGNVALGDFVCFSQVIVCSPGGPKDAK
jgi:hypothetical protein